MKRRTEEREGAGGGTVLVLVVALALLVGGGWFAAYRIAGDNVPRGTEIGGVDIGGRSERAAAAALRTGLADRARKPIAVDVDGGATARSVSVMPDEAGLRVDYRASVAKAARKRTWKPDGLWDYYTRDHRLDPVVAVDETKLDALVQRLATSVGSAPRDGQVLIRDGSVSTREPRAGRGLDVDATRKALMSAYLTDEPARVQVVARPPEIDAVDIADALDRFANPALSGPVTLVFGNQRVRLSPRDYANDLSLVAHDGRLVPTLAPRLLEKLVRDGARAARPPVGARLQVAGGRPAVVPDRPGASYAAADVRAAFVRAAGRRQGRVAQVRATPTPAAVTGHDLRSLRIVEQVGAFSTRFTARAADSAELGGLARRIDRTVLRPDQTFSLVDRLGAAGEGAAGSQLATTLFNAAFLAGLMDVEHHPHPAYIARFPRGRDASLTGRQDLRFRNDTDHGVLVVVRVVPATGRTPGRVVVRLFGTRAWDVGVRTSAPSAPVAPGRRDVDTPGCRPSPGRPGFEVAVTRTFSRPGTDQVDHQATRRVVYAPDDAVACVTPR